MHNLSPNGRYTSSIKLLFRGDRRPPRQVFEEGFSRSWLQKLDSALFAGITPVWMNVTSSICYFAGRFGSSTSLSPLSPYHSGLGYHGFSDNIIAASLFPLGTTTGYNYVYVLHLDELTKAFDFFKQQSEHFFDGFDRSVYQASTGHSFSNEQLLKGNVPASLITGCFKVKSPVYNPKIEKYYPNQNASKMVAPNKIMEFIDKFNKSKNIQTYVNQCMNTSGPINDPNDPRVDARKRLVTDFRKDMSSYNKILLQSKTNVGANYQEHEKISAQPSPEIHAPNNIKFRATKSFICCFLTCSPLAIASCCFCQTPLVSTCSALVLASGATACVDCVSNHIAHD